MLSISCSNPTGYESIVDFKAPLRVSPIQVLTPGRTRYQLLIQTTTAWSSSEEIVTDVKLGTDRITIDIKGIRTYWAGTKAGSYLDTFIDLGYLADGDHKIIFNLRGWSSEVTLTISKQWFKFHGPLHPRIYYEFIQVGRFPSKGLLVLAQSRSEDSESFVQSYLDSLESFGAIPSQFTQHFSGYFSDSQNYWYGVKRMGNESTVTTPNLSPMPDYGGFVASPYLFHYEGERIPLMVAAEDCVAWAEREGKDLYLRLIDSTGWTYVP